MEFFIFISYVFFAFLLFLLLNFFIKKFHLSNIEYVIFTNIFLFFLAGCASYFRFVTFCDDLFLIVVFEFLIRMIYTSYFLEKDFFAKEDRVILLYSANVVFAYLLNQCIIRQVEMVFLSPEQLKFLLWVVIILFCYHFFYQQKDVAIKLVSSKNVDLGDKKQYIISQYAKMKQKYGKDISVQGDMRFLVYSLMIFENYQRPSVFRQFDYFRYQFDHIPKKQGIMQVDSKKILSDIESIEYIEKRFEKLQAKKKTKNTIIDSSDLLKGIGKKKEEIIQIEKIYQYLKEFSEL